MTDDYFDQIGEIIDAHWTDDDPDARAKAFGEMYDKSEATARAAWTKFGVDPDSPLLRSPYVRNDGASRIGLDGAVYGGGLDPKVFPAPPEGQGWTADWPAIPGAHGVSSKAYLAHQSQYAPPVEDDGNLLPVALLGLFLAFVIGIPLMIWIGG